MFRLKPGLLTIIGALLPLALGATLGMMTTDTDQGTLAYPMPSGAFVALSVGLAVAHALVIAGYLDVGRRSTGLGRTFCQVGAVGTALVAGVELWSGALASVARDSGAVTALSAGFFTTGLIIAIGTVGAGIALRPSLPRLARPLLVNGLFLALVVIPVRFLGNDELAIAALTIWQASYVWLGVALLRTTPPNAPVTDSAERLVLDNIEEKGRRT
ncbi:MAG: hypothetical protein ACLFRT_04600 [Actinomycetota bacterium]